MEQPVLTKNKTAKIGISIRDYLSIYWKHFDKMDHSFCCSVSTSHRPNTQIQHKVLNGNQAWPDMGDLLKFIKMAVAS